MTARADVTEAFETDFSASLFGGKQLLVGSGRFVTELPVAGPGTPDSVPALPVGAAGDKVVRYYEAGPDLAFTHSIALTSPLPEVPHAFQQIGGYIAIRATGFGSPSGGLLLRASETPSSSVNGYVATINAASPSFATLSLCRITDGIINQQGVLRTTVLSADFDRDNFRVLLTAAGNQITAEFWQVRVVNGAIVETKVAPLTATDTTYPQGGRAGLYAFSRGNNAVYFDDVTLWLPPPGRIGNISVRGSLGTGDNVLISGFSVAGAGSLRALVRGVGPRLADFGVTDAVPNPRLDLYRLLPGNRSETVAENDDWTAGGTDALNAVFAASGAFSLGNDMRSAALVRDLPAGGYTPIVSGVGTTNTGTALAEVFVVSAGNAELLNVSGRGRVAPGNGALIAGFGVADYSARFLIRAVGPTLASFNVTGTLADPRLTLHQHRDGTSAVVAQNDNWTEGDGGGLAAAALAAGAFPLVAGSKDAALIVTLEPGTYSVVVDDPVNGAGIAMVEVYRLPNLPFR